MNQSTFSATDDLASVIVVGNKVYYNIKTGQLMGTNVVSERYFGNIKKGSAESKFEPFNKAKPLNDLISTRYDLIKIKASKSLCMNITESGATFSINGYQVTPANEDLDIVIPNIGIYDETKKVLYELYVRNFFSETTVPSGLHFMKEFRNRFTGNGNPEVNESGETPRSSKRKVKPVDVPSICDGGQGSKVPSNEDRNVEDKNEESDTDSDDEFVMYNKKSKLIVLKLVTDKFVETRDVQDLMNWVNVQNAIK